MAEPISLPEAKKHLRVDAATDDALITEKIIAAREWVEDFTGLILTRREVTESLNGFSIHTKLRAWPIADDQPVAVAYRDQAGAAQTIENIVLRASSRPGFIYPPVGSWPRCAAGAIDVTFTAGFLDPASVPAALKQAMFVMLTAFYEDREGGALFAAAERSARGLCRGSRSWR